MRQRRSSPINTSTESESPAPSQEIPPEVTKAEPAKAKKPRVSKAALKAEAAERSPELPIFVPVIPVVAAAPAAKLVPLVSADLPAEPVSRVKKAAAKPRPRKTVAEGSSESVSQKPASEPSPEPQVVSPSVVAVPAKPIAAPVLIKTEPVSKPEPVSMPAPSPVPPRDVVAPIESSTPRADSAPVQATPVRAPEPAAAPVAPSPTVTSVEAKPFAKVESTPTLPPPPKSDAVDKDFSYQQDANNSQSSHVESGSGNTTNTTPPAQSFSSSDSSESGVSQPSPANQQSGQSLPSTTPGQPANGGGQASQSGQGTQGAQHGQQQPNGRQQGFDRNNRNFRDKNNRWDRNNRRGGGGGGKYFNRNGQGADGGEAYPENGPGNRSPGGSAPQYQTQVPAVSSEPAVPLPPGPHLDITEIQAKPPRVLKEFAKEHSIENPTAFKRHDLICEIMKRNVAKNGSASSSGVLELDREGHGFLRSPKFNYLPCPEDPYVSLAQVRRHNLRRGEFIQGGVRIPRDKERYFALAKLDQIEGKVAEEGRVRPAFDSLTAMFPSRRIFLEGVKEDISMRAMDLICPLGFGQRGLIVAPPRTGKTILLQKIANAVMENNPQAHLMMILIDERPEEVTDMVRTVKGEVLASTFDETADRHIHVAELAIERAKRLVENKVDVVILMDSITRLTRAYNAMEGNTGKIGTGGIVPSALQRAKRLFGIARNVQEGGSLTIIATALVDTGGKMDDIIFEEFKGTGNMEVNLDRNLSDQRIFPAFNIQRSGTRKEELLYHPDELARIHALRRVLAAESPIEAMTLLLEKIKKTQNNIEFLMSLKT